MNRERQHQTSVALSAIAALVLLAGTLWVAFPNDAADTVPAQNPRVSNKPAKRSLVDFGVVGDGKADDTVAIQRVVDSGIGDVRLAKGVYRITKPIVVSLDTIGVTSFHGNGVATIRMDGPGSVLLINSRILHKTWVTL